MTRVRLTAFAAASALAVAVALAGCTSTPTPECSDQIADTWAPDGSTRLHDFPQPALLADIHARCFVAVEVGGTAYGEAVVEGVGAEKRITDALAAHDWRYDKPTDTWGNGNKLASVDAERELTADDGVPELTGKTVSVLYVGPQPD